jgi:hypothetical protein
MKLRTLKRRTAASVLCRARILAGYHWTDEMGEDHYFHDDDGQVHDRTCRQCDGTGGDRWNDGILPCPACDGEGYEWWN